MAPILKPACLLKASWEGIGVSGTHQISTVESDANEANAPEGDMRGAVILERRRDMRADISADDDETR